jgi:uncharacterized repeat protein (TIGR02543 family)
MAALLLAACDNPTGGGSNQPQITYYTVTFDANGGSPAPEPQSVALGGKASRPPAMSKAASEVSEGLYRAALDELSVTVSGWYTDAACTTAWSFDTPVTGPLTLYAKWTDSPSEAVDLSGQSGAHVLEKALAWIARQTPARPTNYTVVLAGNYAMSGIPDTDNSNISTANAVVTLIGKTPSEISLSSNGPLFYISNGELVLDNNITLKGRSANSYSLVYVGGSSTSLRMKAGAKISGNSGGGVYVYGNGSAFTMSGGEISGNSSYFVGGVYVDGGSFTMTGGEISGNSANSGGGVSIDEGAFTMSGGEISGNTAANYGGGVDVWGEFTMFGGKISGNSASMLGGGTALNGGGVAVWGEFTMFGGEISGNTGGYLGGGVYVPGAFTMSGGEISGNTAANYGGGVDVSGTFTMSGGEISGNTGGYLGGGVDVSGAFTMSGGEISGNTAGDGGGVAVFGTKVVMGIDGGSFSKTGGLIYGDTDAIHTPGSTENTAKYGNTGGHAVYYETNSGNYYRNATLDTGDNISTGDTLPATSGQTVGNWTKK